MHRITWTALGWFSAAVGGAVGGACLVRTGRSLVSGTPSCPADALLLTAVALSTVLLGRLTVCCLAMTAAHLVRRTRRPRLDRVVRALALATCPRVLRSGVAAALTVGLSASGIGAATASLPRPDPGRSHPTSTATATATATGTGTATRPSDLSAGAPQLPGAVWPVSAGRPRPGPAPARPAAPGQEAPGPDAEVWVVVRPGECLWLLAAERLGPDASDAAIAVEWHRWWRANRAAIGPEPDRLLSGSRLRVPPAHRPGRRIPVQRGAGGAA